MLMDKSNTKLSGPSLSLRPIGHDPNINPNFESFKDIKAAICTGLDTFSTSF
jgi:hypothetical protein